MKTKNCLQCKREFSPKRLFKTALTCSAYCNTKRWRDNNLEKNRQIKRKWRWHNGTLKRGSPEYIKMQAENSWGNKNRWKGGYENHLMHARNRRVMKLNAEGNHALEEWSELKKQFDYACIACMRIEPDITLSEDHIIPLTKGGSNNIENIQPLCRSCNSRKGNRSMDYLLEKLA